MTVLVFVPLDASAAAALRAGNDPGPRPAAAPTPGLAGTAGPDAMPEEVEFAALSHAGVLALTTGSEARRLVLAAEVGADQVTDPGDALGQVVVRGLRWTQVRSLFVDEADAVDAVARTRAAVRGLDLADALAATAVQELAGAYDLLWFAVEELDHL